MIDAGVKVLKLEGRGRAAEYVYTVVGVYREAIDAYYAGQYTPQRIKEWEERLRKVYNRGFWDGYYLGRKLGQWSGDPGSHATRRKVYVGKGLHFYPKASVGEILIEAAELHKGDEIIITGPTTGVETLIAEDFMVNDVPADKAVKGDHVTLRLNFKLRPSDKLYKWVETEFAGTGGC